MREDSNPFGIGWIMNVSAPQCVHTFLRALFPRACVWLNYPRYPTVVCDLFRQSTTSDWYDNWKKIPKSVTVSLSSILLFLPNPILHIITLSISSCQSVPVPLLFFSFVSSLPYPLLSTSPSPYHYFLSFSHSSVSACWLTVQTCRGKLGCSCSDRPFVLISSSSSSITVSTPTHTCEHTYTSTHTACSNRKPVQVPGLVN